MAQMPSQEWGQRFNPYTGQWEDLDPPAAEPPDSQPVYAPAPQPAPPPPVKEWGPDYTSKEAARLILEHGHEAESPTKWLYEQPTCPSMHYHKALAGKDRCANPLGDDVDVGCPAGMSLVVDHHPAGSDACRSRRSW